MDNQLMEKVADLLAGTREYIEKNGWWRGGLIGPNKKQRCVLGAEYDTLGLYCGDMMPHEMLEANKLVVSYINGTKPHPNPKVYANLRPHRRARRVDTVDEWNDYFAIDKQHVLDTLAKAEKIARAGYDPDA